MRVAETNNENHIMEAARKLFLIKGFKGTSTQEIAKEAGTTKSMVNYYFRSKDKLFAKIFREEFKNLFASIASCIGSDLPLKEKIAQIVKLDIEKLMVIPELPLFVVSELHRNPEMILNDIEQIPIKNLITKLDKDIKLEVLKGVIKPITPIELMMNIQALTIYPILSKPLLIHRLGLSEKTFNESMEKRKKSIADMIWKSIQV